MSPSISNLTAVCLLAATAHAASTASAPEVARVDPARHVYERWDDHPVQAAVTVERGGSAHDSTANPAPDYKDRADAADAEHRRELYEAVLRARISD